MFFCSVSCLIRFFSTLSGPFIAEEDSWSLGNSPTLGIPPIEWFSFISFHLWSWLPPSKAVDLALICFDDYSKIFDPSLRLLPLFSEFWKENWRSNPFESLDWAITS